MAAGLTKQQKIAFNQSVSEAKEHERLGDVHDAVKAYERAASIFVTEQITRKIHRLKERLQLESEEKENQSSTQRQISSSTTTTKKLLSSTTLEIKAASTPSVHHSSPTSKEHPLSSEKKRGVEYIPSLGFYRDLTDRSYVLLKEKEEEKKKKATITTRKIEEEDQTKETTIMLRDPLAEGLEHFRLDAKIFESLFEHQQEGIRWLWSLHVGATGGILGDDMGLGKTRQVISFLLGCFRTGQCRTVLILLPLSLIDHWQKEFERVIEMASPNPTDHSKGSNNPHRVRVEVFHGNKKPRLAALAKIRQRGGVLLATYGMALTEGKNLFGVVPKPSKKKKGKKGKKKKTTNKKQKKTKKSSRKKNGSDDEEEEDEEEEGEEEEEGDLKSADDNEEGGEEEEEEEEVGDNEEEIEEEQRQAAQELSGNPEFAWDWLILDEGHKIKNPSTRIGRQLKLAVGAKRRLLLTGTPVSNNLHELWSLFDFATKGSLLGAWRRFRAVFEEPIVAARDRTAPSSVVQYGSVVGERLRATIAPHFLRREKRDVFTTKSSTSPSKPSSSALDMTSSPQSPSKEGVVKKRPLVQLQLTRKNDLVVWVRMTSLQERIYRAFLGTEKIARVVQQYDSPLAAITILKKLCIHPRLINSGEVTEKALEEEEGKGEGERERERNEDEDEQGIDEDDVDKRFIEELMKGEERIRLGNENDRTGAAWRNAKTKKFQEQKELGEEEDAIEGEEDGEVDLVRKYWEENGDEDAIGSVIPDPVVANMVRQSGKLIFLILLVKRLKEEGHRTLVFSQSTRMLDLIQTAFLSAGFSFVRLDGRVTKIKERRRIIDKFTQAPPAGSGEKTIDCFLLTSQVAGLGLTLTQADRIVIFDPAWNTLDDQSADRVYRPGQTRDVVIYRLYTCGSIEEKIYRKQVFKAALMKVVAEKDDNEHASSSCFEERQQGKDEKKKKKERKKKAYDRYFTGQELRELFSLSDTCISETQRQLEKLHDKTSTEKNLTSSLKRHLEALQAQCSITSRIISGFSHHDLLFSKEDEAHHHKQQGKGDDGEGDGEDRSDILDEAKAFQQVKAMPKVMSTPSRKPAPSKKRPPASKYGFSTKFYYGEDEEELTGEEKKKKAKEDLLRDMYSSLDSNNTRQREEGEEGEDDEALRPEPYLTAPVVPRGRRIIEEEEEEEVLPSHFGKLSMKEREEQEEEGSCLLSPLPTVSSSRALDIETSPIDKPTIRRLRRVIDEEKQEGEGEGEGKGKGKGEGEGEGEEGELEGEKGELEGEKEEKVVSSSDEDKQGNKKSNQSEKKSYVHRVHSSGLKSVDSSQRQSYNSLIEKAMRKEEEEEGEVALEYYLKALGIYDGDAKLHLKILAMSKELGLLNLAHDNEDEGEEEFPVRLEDEDLDLERLVFGV